MNPPRGGRPHNHVTKRVLELSDSNLTVERVRETWGLRSVSEAAQPSHPNSQVIALLPEAGLALDIPPRSCSYLRALSIFFMAPLGQYGWRRRRRKNQPPGSDTVQTHRPMIFHSHSNLPLIKSWNSQLLWAPAVGGRSAKACPQPPALPPKASQTRKGPACPPLLDTCCLEGHHQPIKKPLPLPWRQSRMFQSKLI